MVLHCHLSLSSCACELSFPGSRFLELLEDVLQPQQSTQEVGLGCLSCRTHRRGQGNGDGAAPWRGLSLREG